MAEAVDRLDTEAAARSIQNLREQRARAILLHRIGGLTERLEVSKQRRWLHSHPGRKPLAHARRHLCSAGLGEGQAEDRCWIHAAQQQAKDARRQNLRLASPRRRGKPHVRVRRAGAPLFAAQRG